MKKMYLAVLLITAFISRINAQQWQWAVDARGVSEPKIITLNNSLYITGSFQYSCSVNGYVINSAFPHGGFVAKVDANGNVLWDTHFGASTLRIADIKSFNNGIYIAGSFQGTLTGYTMASPSAGSSDLFFMRISESGNVDMVKTDGSPEFENAVSFDVDSTVIVQGQFSAGASISGQTLTSQCSGTMNVYFAKYALTGANIWVKEVAGTPNESALAISIRFDKNRDIIFQGECSGAMNYAGTFMGQCQLCRPLLRFNAAGAFVAHILDAQSGIAAYRLSEEICLDDHNNIYNLVHAWGSHSAHEIALEKFTATGASIYNKTLVSSMPGSMGSSQGGSTPRELVIKGGKAYVAGDSYGKAYFIGGDTIQGLIMYVEILDTAGNYQDAAMVTGNGWEQIEMAADNLNNVYVTGVVNNQANFGSSSVNTNNSASQVFLAKLNIATPVSVKEYEKPVYFSLFPNPSDGKFFLRIAEPAAGANVCVYDALGRCVYSASANGPLLQVDLGRQNKGLYILKAESGKTKFQEKIVIH